MTLFFHFSVKTNFSSKKLHNFFYAKKAIFSKNAVKTKASSKNFL